MPESQPVKVDVPGDGFVFVESVHARDFSMAERREDFHKLFFAPAGRIALETRHGGAPTTSEGERGSLWVVPAGLRHRIVDREPSVLLILCLGQGFFRSKDLEALWSRLETKAGPPLYLPTEVENWWRRAILEGSRKAFGWEASQQAIALQLLVAMARLNPSGDSTSRERIRRVRRRVEETLFEPWNLANAAGAAGLSRRQFSKLFRIETGGSFVEFLTEKRLEHVENLLKSGRSTVTGAAFSAGFEDLSHFYRLFRRRTGWAPKAWLERVHESAKLRAIIRPTRS